MGSLFRRSRRDAPPAPSSNLPTFTPNPDRVWNRWYCLDPNLAQGCFTLAMDYEMWGLPGYEHRDRTRLIWDGAQQSLELKFGPLSTIPTARLASLAELTAMSYRRNDYIHERDWPAEDEPAVQVIVRLQFGKRFLAFMNSDYRKLSPGYAGPALLAWLKKQAQVTGLELQVSQGRERERGGPF